MMNCIECPWFESCDEIDESYCINDKLTQIETELKENGGRRMTIKEIIDKKERHVSTKESNSK